MKVAGELMKGLPNLFDYSNKGKPELKVGVQLARPMIHHDLLEISEDARRIGADREQEAVKLHIPERPAGAPDDYVNPSELMKRFEPQTFDKMTAFFEQQDPQAGLSILLNFVKKLPDHPEWTKQYREEMSRPTVNLLV